MKNTTRQFLLVLFFLTSILVSAQPGNPTSPAPFGFVELIALGGVTYGGYKTYKRRKESA